MNKDELSREEDRKPTEDEESGTSDGGGRPTIREAQSPMGQPAPANGTWLSGDDDDPLREETIERARRAVEPGHPRE